MEQLLEIKVDEVVQLNPEKTKNVAFAGCMMVVTEIKTWGCQGYIQGIGTREESGGVAYYRATWEEIVKLENNCAKYVLA